MKLMERLGKLSRATLIGLILALAVIEAGLIWAGWQAMPQSHVATLTRPAQTPVPDSPGAGSTAVGSGPTAETIRTPVVGPVIRTGGPLVAQGDLAGVALLFDVEEAMSFVETLTCPEWGGRQGGSPGGADSAAYIADEFEDYGLRPAGTEGYFQPFLLPYAEILGMPTFVVTATAGAVYDDFVYSENFRFAWGGYSGGGAADGRVFWLNEGQPGDYDQLDVRDGIVFCRYSPGDEVTRQAVEHGADGLILLAQNERQVTTLRTYREPAYLPESLPTLLVSEEVAEVLLEGSGYSVQDLSILYESLPLTTVTHFEVFLDEPGEAMGRNVLGVLPGADPNLRHEVVIVGGHYDHVGVDADGRIYSGANDNASGVAVLLEIARNWQQAGFTPDRTVLFAAWDGEEQGLLGSVHYVRHPRYPLEDTVAMIQLDMVGLSGAGVMTIDGYGTVVGRQLQASARMLDVPTRQSAIRGRSDHAPFQQSGIPAVLLIWDDAEVPFYHTPEDTADTLEPERLRQTGLMTSHTAMMLADAMPRLQKLLLTQAEAVIAGDSDAYLATLDPDDGALYTAGRSWLDSRSLEAREAYTVSVGTLEVGETTARADTSISGRFGAAGAQSTIAYPVQMVRRGREWYTTWPIDNVITATHVVAQFITQEEDDDAWVMSLDEIYARLCRVLGYREQSPVAVTVYPSAGALDWLAGAGEGETTSPLPGTHMERTGALTSTAMSLILDQMGLPQGQGDWLRVGLSKWVNASGDAETWRELETELLARADANISAGHVMTGTRSTFGLTATSVAASLVGRLMESEGSGGLLRLCEAWGETGSQEGAFLALGTSPLEFAEDWEGAVLSPILAVREGVQATLDQRKEAVASGDKAAFLSTLDPGDTVFLAEETGWFEYLAEHPAENYHLRAELLSFDEETALVRLVTTARIAGENIQVGHDARFGLIDESWVLTGPDWSILDGEHATIRYSGITTDTAESLLETVERAYAQIRTDIGYSAATRIEVKLYADDDVFRASVLPPVPSSRLWWHEPGTSIKLSPRIPATDVSAAIVRGLSEQALHDLGLDLTWLQQGIALFESVRVFPDLASSLAPGYVPAVREGLRRQGLFDWDEMPEAGQLDGRERTLLYGQAWMLVDQLVDEFGLPTLNRLVRSVADGESFREAFALATGVTLADWEPLWKERVRTGGVSAEWIAAAQAFDPERALATVKHLSSSEYGGRRAGSAQAEKAALWIADQMEAAGLEPGAPDGTFLQSLPLPYTELVSMPSVELRSTEDGETMDLVYRENFCEVTGGYAGGGQVDSRLIWLPTGFTGEMDLGGRVAIKKRQFDPTTEAADAREHGAGGLILVSRYPKMREREIHSPDHDENTIPVIEIPEASWTRLLGLVGMTNYEAMQAPPALVMPVQCRLLVPYGPVRDATALNVVGVLPGSVPGARALVIVSNYDGVGVLPDGTLYPGANQNASGVAAMLEVARLWHESGYTPERPIYFIAWGAEEPGLTSASHYAIREPIVPLTQMMGLLELDRVGASRSYYLNLDWETHSSSDPLFTRGSVAGRQELYAVEQRAMERDLLFNLELAGELLDRRLSRGRTEEASSHEIFRRMGVPSVLLFWPDARDTRTPEDTPETIEPYKLATAGEVVMLTSLMLAQ